VSELELVVEIDRVLVLEQYHHLYRDLQELQECHF
jgi:hypothetical protein